MTKMVNRMRFLLVLAVAAVLLLAVVGPALADEKIVVTVNNGPKEGDEAAIKIMNERLKRFYAKYPNIEVKNDPWIYDPESFTVKFAGGTATDVIYVAATEMGLMTEHGYAADITEVMKSWEHYDDIHETFLAGATRDGRIYGVPVHGYVMGLVYNKKLFREAGIEEPPTTWEEFVEAAVKLTNPEKGIAGFGIMGSGGQGGWQMLNWIWQAGGELEQKINGKWKATFNSPETVKAFEFIRDLRWKYKVLQPNTLINAERIFPLMANERIGMFLGTPEWIPIIVENYGGNLEDLGIAPLPAGPAGHANQMGGLYAMINGKVTEPKKIEAAFKWIVQDFDLVEYEARLKTKVAEGKLVGVPEFLLFKPEAQEVYNEIMDKYRNMPEYDSYNREAGKYARPEPPFFAQQLYVALESVLQAVLTDPYADIEKLLNRAAADFERRFLRRIP